MERRDRDPLFFLSPVFLGRGVPGEPRAASSHLGAQSAAAEPGAAPGLRQSLVRADTSCAGLGRSGKPSMTLPSISASHHLPRLPLLSEVGTAGAGRARKRSGPGAFLHALRGKYREKESKKKLVLVSSEEAASGQDGQKGPGEGGGELA